LRDAYDEIRATGARLVVIGNGQPWQAKAFRQDEQIPFELWVDPDMRAYRAAGLRRGWTKALSHRSLAHAVRALRGGYRQTKVEGDPWQLGGAFVITPAGAMVYEQVSREAGDHAAVPDLLAALRRARRD
jgi:peroxiredoxin